jgi:hypothetical protein
MQNGSITTRQAPAYAIVAVRPELFAHMIEAAAADLRRGGQAVGYRELARYTDIPEYVLRKVVELKPMLDGMHA